MTRSKLNLSDFFTEFQLKRNALFQNRNWAHPVEKLTKIFFSVRKWNKSHETFRQTYIATTQHSSGRALSFSAGGPASNVAKLWLTFSNGSRDPDHQLQSLGVTLCHTVRWVRAAALASVFSAQCGSSGLDLSLHSCSELCTFTTALSGRRQAARSSAEGPLITASHPRWPGRQRKSSQQNTRPKQRQQHINTVYKLRTERNNNCGSGRSWISAANCSSC